MRKNLRSKARAAALQTLYQIEAGAPSVEVALARMHSHFEPPPLDNHYLNRLVEGVIARRDEVDDLVRAAAPDWKPGRMTVVDRNILRLGVFELLSESVPPKVALAEAVVLADRYGGERSTSFINGVLDRVAQGLGRL